MDTYKSVCKTLLEITLGLINPILLTSRQRKMYVWHNSVRLKISQRRIQSTLPAKQQPTCYKDFPHPQGPGKKGAGQIKVAKSQT